VKPSHKVVLVGTIAAGILLVVGISAFTFLFSTMCGNDTIVEFLSPDASAKLVVFQRDCGATTAFSTQASLLKPGVHLSDRSGNVFVADTHHGLAPSGPKGGPELRVLWESPKHLLLQHHAKARVFRAEQNLNGVEIRYETFP
jgi:hypothetical protein